MRVAPLLITLAAIGALFLLSTSFGVRSEVPVGLGTDPQHLHPESLRAANGERRRAKQLTRLAALEQAASEQLESAAAATAAATAALSAADAAAAAAAGESGGGRAAATPPRAAAPASAAATNPAPTPARPAKPCAPGCEAHGVCNSELGRCDCPPFMGGDDCTRSLLPACAAAVGLAEVAPAPCVIDTLTRAAPVSCECLMGCEKLNLMGVRECYLMDPGNATVVAWTNHQKHMRGLETNREYWESSLKLAARESAEKCSGHGVFAPHKPVQGAPPTGARKFCQCYAGWSGTHCERSTAQRQQQACLNGCSQRGECVRNWCHCRRGFYGTDCSLGADPPGTAEPAPALPPPLGARAQGAGAPKIYVYELPPRFNSWMHAGAGGWWQDLDLWGEDVAIHRRMLRSSYRVTNPEEADYFLVPVWVSSAMWQMNWGFRDLLPTGVRAIKEATAYIRSTWPHFDRNGGADHLWVFGHDQGSWRIRTKVPEIAAGIFISPFGGGSAQRGGHRGGHTVGGVTEPQHDIVVPPLLYADVPKGLLNHKGRRKVSPQNLAFFQGKLNLHIPYASRSPGTLCLGERLTYGGGHFCHRYEYSFGVRQSLFKTHRNTPRIVIKEGHEADREEYFANMAGSKFCVAAAGFGFSTRAYEAALAGCAPLVMQDGIPQAFEDLLPWPLFSLRLNDSLAQIPSETLTGAPAALRVTAALCSAV